MATHIKDIIGNFIKKSQNSMECYEKIEQIKNNTLDPETKKHIHLKGVSKKQIIFISDSSVFSYNFNLQKRKILKEIQQVIPEVQELLIKIN